MWSPQLWWRRRLLRRHAIAEQLWRATITAYPLLEELTAPQQRRLRELATLLLATKQLNGAAGFEPDAAMRVTIMALAALPILALDLDWYENWHEIVLYPDSFIQEQEWQDKGGVTHRQRRALDGEAWLQGPVILAWHDIADGAHGAGLVVHELAHKLDMLNGVANGFPPLHREMSGVAWTDAFSAAYADLHRHIAQGLPPPIDPYGATNPAEFFAVVSAAFFLEPQHLHRSYPAVYAQLCAFYRQQPLDKDSARHQL